jgi:hypothetical protein
MKQKNELLIVGIAVILVFVAGALFFSLSLTENTDVITTFEECIGAGFPVMESYPRQCNANGQTFVEEIAQEPKTLPMLFWEKATTKMGAMPVEGFNPALYKGVFPKLIDQDFHNTQAIGGMWKFENNKLILVRNTNEITSADGTLTNEGVYTLFANLEKRLNLQIETKGDIDTLVKKIS